MKTLKQRVEALENIVYRKFIERCPRCKAMGMNAWQEGICNLCGYQKGDDKELELRNH